MGLTKKQLEVYQFIKTYMDREGLCPTQKEIRDHFGLKSFGSVQRYLKYLIDAEMIELAPNERRGITLIDSNSQKHLPGAVNSFEEIPFCGNVAAGNPIEVIEQASENIPVPRHMIKRPGRYFALSVQGDSMIDEGIHDGDIAVCRHETTASNGQIVVAIWNEETTLKTFFRKNNQIELHPANSTLSPWIVGPEHSDFRIAGKLVGLLRSYES